MVPDAMKCAHANNYNSRSIGIEHEARAALGDFTEEMLQASAKVCAVMLRKFGIPLDGDHIIGHYMVPGTTHTDPGSKFPWIDYLDMVEKRYHTLSEW
jgi:N-acetyl-anhydromuramyl-L-alanine amidase AmpD